MEISKELLGEVLELDIQSFYISETSNNNLTMQVRCPIKEELYSKSINIYELAHKCKEWALSKECELLSCIRDENTSLCDIYSDVLDCKFTHYANTEPEAIFKACEWILKELK